MHAFCSGWLVAPLALAGLELARDVAPDDPTVLYTLRYEPAQSAPYWVVTIEARGLPRRAKLAFELSEWGGWSDNPGYLEIVECEPALDAIDLEAGRLEIDGARDVTLTYRLGVTRLGGDAQQRFGLLPTASDEYSYGYSWNTLMQVSVNDQPLEGARALVLEAPSGMTIVTGWAGRSTDRQRTELEPEMGNGPIAFGEPATVRLGGSDDFAVEVYQFGAGPDVTATVEGVLLACAPAIGRQLGVPARNPYRAFVTDTQGGGMGSHFGLRIGVMEGTPAEHAESPWLRSHITHELFHDWLGVALSEQDRTLVWFKEGFTEYFALWHAAAAGLVPREWFATRLLELEQIARSKSSAGQVAFADPEVNWRDGDGPNETLAYTGAPLLALRIDAELRAAGRPGLLAMVRDFLALEHRSYGQADIREWMEAQGLAERYRRSVAGRELPDVGESLALAGFATTRVATDLTYVGLRTDIDRPGATVLAVDPDGPAAAAGFVAGDRITGWWPGRGDPPDASEVESEFRFGLTLFAPGMEGTYLGVDRDGTEHKLFLEPEVLAGRGYFVRPGSVPADAKALDAFFAK